MIRSSRETKPILLRHLLEKKVFMSEFKAPEVVSTRFSCSQVLCIAKQPFDPESIVLRGCPGPSLNELRKSGKYSNLCLPYEMRGRGPENFRTKGGQTNRLLRCGVVGFAIETIGRGEFSSSRGVWNACSESHRSV